MALPDITIIDPRFTKASVTTRLCPLQVLGKRATSTARKAKSCLRMLSLEADPADARIAMRSLLSDLGVESALWLLPNISLAESVSEGAAEAAERSSNQLVAAAIGEGERCFPNSMPLADFDHMLHLAMTEAETAFGSVAGEAWLQFDRQVSAISKWFSKRDHVEFFIQRRINQNPRVPVSAKKSLAAMFNALCPTFVKTRWHFGFEVLHWISRRQALFLGC